MLLIMIKIFLWLLVLKVFIPIQDVSPQSINGEPFVVQKIFSACFVEMIGGLVPYIYKCNIKLQEYNLVNRNA